MILGVFQAVSWRTRHFKEAPASYNLSYNLLNSEGSGQALESGAMMCKDGKSRLAPHMMWLIGYFIEMAEGYQDMEKLDVYYQR